MNKFMKSVIAMVAVLILAGLCVANADTVTTVTNRGQVITIKTLGNVATDIKDADLYQDFSIYPSRLGMVGKIIRFYDVGLCGGSGAGLKLYPPVPIPDNVLIRNGYVQTLTASSGITTNSIGLNSAADILGSATNGLTTAATTRYAIIPVGTAGSAVQGSGKTYLTAGISDGVLTAGRFMVVLDCELAP